MNYSAALQTARMQEVVDAIGSAGKFLVCAARDPETPNVLGDVLCEIVLASPAGTVTGNVLTMTAPRSGTSDVTDGPIVAAEGALATSADVIVADDIEIGEEGSGAEAILSETTIPDGKVVTLTAFVATHA